MAEQIAVDVADWDLGSYPDEGKDPRTGKVGSTWWKMDVLTKDGRTEHKMVPAKVRDASGQLVDLIQDGGPRRAAITGGIGSTGAKKHLQGQPCSYLDPVDIRNAEKEVGGKPSRVVMGLFFSPVFDSELNITDWVKQDVKKEHVPKYWRDVTEEYFNEMRPKAYEGRLDPYKNQHRPYTLIQEMTMENNAMRKKLEDENAELKKKLGQVKP